MEITTLEPSLQAAGRQHSIVLPPRTAAGAYCTPTLPHLKDAVDIELGYKAYKSIDSQLEMKEFQSCLQLGTLCAIFLKIASGKKSLAHDRKVV